MSFDSIGDRMKTNYENISRFYLTRRTPVIIRLDGRSFHTFTHFFKKPFDNLFIKTMQGTMEYLCRNVSGCVLGYTQSDEISLLVCDFQDIKTQPWFDYNVQKLSSVTASMATLKFNQLFAKNLEEYISDLAWDYEVYGSSVENQEASKYIKIYERAKECGATFDSRCFNIPKEEVTNYFIWRQQDATRNSIQMVARSKFSDKKLFKLNSNQIQELLFQEAEINWNDFPIEQKRGSCFTYRYEDVVIEDNCGNQEILEEKMKRWFLDREIPVFTQDRDYIERAMRFEKEL